VTSYITELSGSKVLEELIGASEPDRIKQHFTAAGAPMAVEGGRLAQLQTLSFDSSRDDSAGSVSVPPSIRSVINTPSRLQSGYSVSTTLPNLG